jgi:hypothetical protein
MKNEDRPFQVEQVYEQIERFGTADARQDPPSSDARLISRLRLVYAEDREIVEQVWEKLNARNRTNEPREEHETTPELPAPRFSETPVIKPRSREKRPQRFWKRFLELSAALLVVSTLLASMGILLQKAHQQPGSVGRATVIPFTPGMITQTVCHLTHPATLTSLSEPVDPAVFYLRGMGGYQTVPAETSVVRYDLVTGKTTTLLQSTGASAITGVMLSPDRQWLLLRRIGLRNHQNTELQVIRTDGSMLQTVYESCADSGIVFSTMDVWSPNEREIAFADTATSVAVLNLLDGKLQRFVLSGTSQTSYRPAFWADNQHVLIERFDSASASQVGVDLLDVAKGARQTVSALTPITSFPGFCGNIAPGNQGAQLFRSSCLPLDGNCQGRQPQGPSSVSVLPALGGAARAIYTSPGRAVTAIASAGSLSLLIYIDNTGGDLSQDGLWKIQTDGSGLTRLTTTREQVCQYHQEAYPMTQIASDGETYALLYTEGGEQKLTVGSLAGGTPTTVSAHPFAESNILILVGVGIS